MNKSTNFRIVNQTEKRIIEQSLSKIEPKIIILLNKIEYKLYISFNNLSFQGNFPKLYLIPNNLIKIFKNFNQEIVISSSGINCGFIKKNVFFLSLEGAEFLYNLNVFPENNLLFVNNEGEKSILYGNQILKKFIHQISINLKIYDFLLVFNINKELISIAQSRIDYSIYQNLKPDDLIAMNLVDKGYYLREKQQK